MKGPVPPVPRRAANALSVVRLSWGATLLLAPREVNQFLAGDDTRAGRVVARILGGRHLVQALWECSGSPGREGVGSVIDALHALTAVTLARVDPGSRRAATTDAAIAAGFSLSGAWLWMHRSQGSAVPGPLGA